MKDHPTNSPSARYYSRRFQRGCSYRWAYCCRLFRFEGLCRLFDHFAGSLDILCWQDNSVGLFLPKISWSGLVIFGFDVCLVLFQMAVSQLKLFIKNGSRFFRSDPTPDPLPKGEGRNIVMYNLIQRDVNLTKLSLSELCSLPIGKGWGGVEGLKGEPD